MFKWGVPWMINTISGPERRESLINGNDIIPPQQPAISALPEATNSARVRVEGYTEAEAEVTLLINDVVEASDLADKTGFFNFDDATLILGENRIGVSAKDASGNINQSPISLITYDNKPVVVIIESPTDRTELFGKNKQTVEIKGKVNKEDAQVLVNNSFTMIESGGVFSYKLMLSDGENKIVVTATDRAGNRDEEEMKIIFHQ